MTPKFILKDAKNYVKNLTISKKKSVIAKAAYIQGRIDEIKKNKNRTVINKLEDILFSYGFNYSHNLNGWDKHYYKEDTDYLIIFDVKEFCIIGFRNKEELFNLENKNLTLNSLCKVLVDL